MNDLGTLGGEMSGGYGINNAGQVVGWSQTSTGQHHAFLYSDGKMQDIGPLTTSNGSSAEARDINDNGLIDKVGSFGVHQALCRALQARLGKMPPAK